MRVGWGRTCGNALAAAAGLALVAGCGAGTVPAATATPAVGPSTPVTGSPTTVVAAASPAVPSSVPSEFAAACGKPGASVVTRYAETVRHKDCDLTGVVIRIGANGVAATVPLPGHSVGGVADVPSGAAVPSSIEISVDATTGDVTIDTE